MQSFLRSSAALCAILLGCGGPTPPIDANGGDTGVDSGTDGPAQIAGQAFCASLTVPTCNAPAVASCGVCVTPATLLPRDVLTRTPCAALPQLPDGGTDPGRDVNCDPNPPASTPPPDVSCLLNYDPTATPPASQTVTVWGVVDVFGNGGDSNAIVVSIFEVNPDGTPGTMVGQATSSTSSPYTEMETVLDNSGNVLQTRTLGGFVIAGVQTEHAYIIKTQGPTDQFQHALYDYTLPIHNAAIGMPVPPTALAITGPAVQIRPRTIANSDWSTIPSAAGLTSGIPSGNGALAGEVHDCDDIRLSYATVYSTPTPSFTGTVYFSDNATMPLPDTSRASDGTNLLGIYAVLDYAPGPVRVSAVGYLAGTPPTLVSLGSFSARIFPDSVTVVTLAGIRPWQLGGHP